MQKMFVLTSVYLETMSMNMARQIHKKKKMSLS